VTARNPLGLSTFALASPFSDADRDAFRIVAELGYDAIEVCVEDPALLSADVIADAAAEHHLEVAICGTFGAARDLSHEDPAERAAGIAYVERCVDLAAAVGAGHVGGPMYATTGRARPLSLDARAQQRSWAVESLKRAADYAGRRGVRLAIEPLNRFETDLVNTVDQALELCDRVGRPNVGLCLDTFHMNIEERDIAASVRAAAGRVFHVQVSENDRGAPGSGHLPWPSFFGALEAIDYHGQIVVEAFMQTGPIADLAKVWRPVSTSMDALARDGLAFLRASVRA
jgi:D-psicose/D-tagatose/L-ribulose 3-epimerase